MPPPRESPSRRHRAPIVEELERRRLFSTLNLAGFTNNPVTIGDTTQFDATPPLFGLT